jgi:hypothetical protein
MKKISLFLLISVFILMISGCEKKTKNSQDIIIDNANILRNDQKLMNEYKEFNGEL